jgi:hypothetical protein
MIIWDAGINYPKNRVTRKDHQHGDLGSGREITPEHRTSLMVNMQPDRLPQVS